MLFTRRCPSTCSPFHKLPTRKAHNNLRCRAHQLWRLTCVSKPYDIAVASGQGSQGIEPPPGTAFKRLAAGATALAFAIATAVQSPAFAGPASLAGAAEVTADFRAEHWLEEYSAFVKLQTPREAAAGCELCRANRLMLEGTWETVANDFFDPTGSFNQDLWAHQLLETLEEAGGVLPTKKATYQAMQSMLTTLGDRYSQFMPPSTFREAIHQPRPVERQYLAAQYVAAGVVLGGHSSLGGWYVEAVLAESPAEEGGIRRGDRIQTIDGLTVDALSAAEVAALLRGPEGSSVVLGLVSTHGKARWVELTRRELAQPPIRQDNLITPGGRLARYIRVHYFASGTARAVQEALEAGEREGVGGYILDLRNNPGGSFDAGVEVASLFLPQGAPIVTTVRAGGIVDGEWRAGQLPQRAASHPSGPVTAKPLLLLTNTSTASASEMLAGALRDNGRAHIVGERTYGKGVVQEFFGEPDGSGLKLTVAKYLLPSGYDVSCQGGLEPDLLCHDHPRGLTGRPDGCIMRALHAVALLEGNGTVEGG